MHYAIHSQTVVGHDGVLVDAFHGPGQDSSGHEIVAPDQSHLDWDAIGCVD
jgi:hypothetical protein